MRLVWATDIHLNLADREAIDRFMLSIIRAEPEAILIGGDTGVASSVADDLDQILMPIECPVYFVLGNHDFYGGSIGEVRSRIRRSVLASSDLHWLNDSGLVHLTAETGLIGHDSWADGRCGDFYGSPVKLNDFELIEDLKNLDKPAQLERMQLLADEAAEHFRAVLPQAIQAHRHILVLVHVPPFREATRYRGRISDDNWVPFFSCKVVGDVLVEAMEHNPDHHMLVLCGHSHGSSEVSILPNLRVLTGGAVYHLPAIQPVLEIL